MLARFPCLPLRMTGALPAVRAVLAGLAGLALAGVAAPGTAASAGAGLDGDWAVSLRTAEGVRYQAWLQLDGAFGRWKADVQARHNACVGQPVPVSVRESSDRRAELLLAYSQALPGCQDVTLQLQRISRFEWRGAADPGGEIGPLVLSLRRP